MPYWEYRYLYGDCALLAYALAARTGWPLMQILEHGDIGEHDCSDECDGWIVRHALVQMPDGRLLDAAGPHDNYDAEPLDRGEWHSGDPRVIARWQDPGVMADADGLLTALRTGRGRVWALGCRPGPLALRTACERSLAVCNVVEARPVHRFSPVVLTCRNVISLAKARTYTPFRAFVTPGP